MFKSVIGIGWESYEFVWEEDFWMVGDVGMVLILVSVRTFFGATVEEDHH